LLCVDKPLCRDITALSQKTFSLLERRSRYRRQLSLNVPAGVSDH